LGVGSRKSVVGSSPQGEQKSSPLRTRRARREGSWIETARVERRVMRPRAGWWKSGAAIVVWIALGTVGVHLATGWRYGFDRDELMALEDARHLAWGYVQYPPMTAFLGRVALELFGASMMGARFFAAVAMAVAVVLTGLMAKEIVRAGKVLKSPHEESACGAPKEKQEENGEWAMVVAALATVPFCLGGGMLLQYIAFDYLCWAGVGYCVVKAVASGEWRVAREREEKREEVQGCNGARVQGEDWKSGRVKEERSARWWVGVGAGIGLGMLAKYTMAFLAVGVVVGVLATEARRYLRSGWLWLGVVVGCGIFAPNFAWEWKRNFISLEFLKFLHARDVATGQTDWFLLGQLELTLLAFPLAVAGIWFLFFMEEGRRFRILGWMYAVPLVLFMVMRGRDYYLAPAYSMLYAAGSVWVEKQWRVTSGERRERTKKNDKKGDAQANAEMQSAPGITEKGEELEEWEQLKSPHAKAACGAPEEKPKPGRLIAQKPGDGKEHLTPQTSFGITGLFTGAIWVALILDVVAAGAVALPLAPVNSAWWRFAASVDTVFPEEIGWPEFVESVARVRDALPEEERGRAAILAGNYGEVGALNLYGAKFGLPRAISGVNSSWERGYGDPPPETLIVVGYPREFLEGQFASCAVAGRVWNRYGVKNEETVEDPEIFVCRELKGSWEEFWRKVRKFA